MKKQFFFYYAVLIYISPSLNGGEILLLNLETAVNTGLKNNRELIFRGKENIINEKNLNLKYRDFFPDLTVTYSDSASVAYFNPDSHTKKIALSLNQDLYNRGVKKAEINLGKKQLSLEKIKTQEAEDEYTFQIISAFKEILKLQMELSILNNTFDNTSRQLNIGVKEMELGEITKLDFMEMEIAHNNIELLLGKKIIEKDKMLFTFSRLLTLNPDIKLLIEGKINTEYTGFVSGDAEYFINASREKSSAYREKILAGESAYEKLKTVSKINIPAVTADFGISMSGQQFPLTEPGLDISLTFSLDKPGIPSYASAGVNKENNRRSRTLTLQTRPFSEMQQLHNKDSAKIALEKSLWEIENFRISNEFNIKEIFHEITAVKKELLLLKKKLALHEKKLAVEKLQLQLGEIKRIDYMKSTIEYSNEKIRLLNSIAFLYQKEISLLRLCGIKDIIRTGGKLIRSHE